MSVRIGLVHGVNATVSFCVLALCLVAHAAYADQNEAAVRKAAETFRRAILSRDEKTLSQFEPWPGFFFVDGVLNPRIAEFIYVSHPERQEFSVTDIARKGNIVFRIHPAGRSGEYNVLYYPSQFKDQVNNKSFLSSGFMKDYFVCKFAFQEGRVVLVDHFCYDETEGPYGEDDPDL